MLLIWFRFIGSTFLFSPGLYHNSEPYTEMGKICESYTLKESFGDSRPTTSLLNFRAW